jgi:membrane-anchored protein YejM (alkaline phosphatase superfamily)
LWKLHDKQRKFFFVAQLSFTHHYELTKMGMIDVEIENFFKTWVNSPQVRNNTLVILCSDHGNHMYPSEIHAGRLAAMVEQTRPVFYVLLPPWMKDKYPDRVNALAENSRSRLVTYADVHATMRHLTSFKQESFEYRMGVSLFNLIPKDRSCKEAGVPLAFCGCADYERMDPR